MKKWEVYIKHLLHGEVYGGIIEEKHLGDSVVCWTCCFFSGTLFIWKWLTNYGYSFRSGYLAHIYFLKKWSETVTSRKTSVINDRIWFFKRKLEFWKTCICPCELDSFLPLKGFSEEIGDNVYIFKIQFLKRVTWFLKLGELLFS